MQKLSNYHKAMIENYLYKSVLLTIAQYSDKEGNINQLRLWSRRIIFRDRESAAKIIAYQIKKFAIEYKLDISDVKDYLLHIVEHNKKGLKPEEPTEVERIIKSPIEENIK